MHHDTNASTIEHFLDEGLVTKVLRPIKSGKEASVHLCRGNRSTIGHDLVALKVYHPLDRRDFRDESIYRDGEWIKERRIRAALAKKTRFGREVQGGIWVHREWETLRALSAAGAAVPAPIAWTGDAILMSYVGDEAAAAPQLHRYRPDPAEARDLFDQVMAQVERFLYGNVIHGDLSPFNVLVWEGRVTLIDLPQAVDPRKNRHAEQLLERDVGKICEHFGRLGVRSDPGRLSRDLWTAWTFADLVPEDLRTELIVDP
ncbi:MAG TPA: RIO1 family regulatory kinase/ATPase [Actinomycetota bacterium]|nr:RIO1 family regulatory kinase/ATPase [Actinomycetota bacterium]